MNTVNRDLWLDESSMAYSFSQRSLLNLCTSQFEYHQPAPVGWLYICKIFTVIFGNRENVLRITSLLAFIEGGLIISCCLFALSKRDFKRIRDMIIVGFSILLPF